MSEEKYEMTFTQKLENYWYHYKWHTLLGAFSLIIALVCIVQCTGRKEPDAMIMYAGRYNVPDEYREQPIDSVMKEDYNGDGEKKADVFQLIIPINEIDGEYELKDAVAQTNNAEFQRFYTEVASGSTVIYLLHPLFYEQAKSMGVLCPLSDVLEGDVPEYAVDEYGIPVSKLFAYRRTTLCHYPPDSIICIRRERGADSKIIAPDDPDYYRNNVRFFNDIIYY
ncbi:MAG: hypothetical protein IKI97_13225 [Clostridia bacterium]|nr:hypothetical protein [Clostridia bacterium]